MATYQVSFFKYLLSSDGHRFKALQKAIRVHSADRDEAVETAKKNFARVKGVTHWRTHADLVEVTPIEEERVSQLALSRGLAGPNDTADPAGTFRRRSACPDG